MTFIHAARRAAELCGLSAFAWKLRKVDLGITAADLVLDVGSGSAPNPYADVLVECDPNGHQTNSGPARSNGKLLLWADAEQMPFRDGAFDVALCFHLLEHVRNPAACLDELNRVARRGYIETPNEIFDYVIPYRDHRNRVSFDGELLRILRKDRWNVERFPERYGSRRARQVFALLATNPRNLHVCYRWTGRIQYTISDEVIQDAHPAEENAIAEENGAAAAPWLNSLATRIVRRRKLPEERLLSILRCIGCHSSNWSSVDGTLACQRCSRVYRRFDGHFDFRP